jgi:Holliday junction resolvase RusA-like endonuclease
VSSIEFIVAGRPQQRGSKRPVRNKKTGATIMLDDNAKSKPWMAAVASAASEAMNGRPLLDGPLEISVVFLFKRPKSHFYQRKSGQVRRDDAPRWHASTPDLDKAMRAIGDAMTGVVYRDDAQISAATLVKQYTDSSERATVRVSELIAERITQQEAGAKPDER